MVFYAESSLGSSLHNNGHAENKIKEQLGINGVSFGTNGRSYTLAVLGQSSALCLQECQQSRSPNFQEGFKLGTQTQERDVTDLIFSGQKLGICLSWPFILGDTRGICGSLIEI